MNYMSMLWLVSITHIFTHLHNHFPPLYICPHYIHILYLCQIQNTTFCVFVKKITIDCRCRALEKMTEKDAAPAKKGEAACQRQGKRRDIAVKEAPSCIPRGRHR